MKRFSIWMKCITWFLVFSLLCELIPEKLFAAEGPAAPNAAQFEPVDASDMVNLFTGDFAYNIPLLEVPGPEGNWPINMSYHASIGPNTEASWVGLGWSLNPGAINRFISGNPDDYLAGNSEFYTRKKLASGYGIGVSFSWAGHSVGINYSSNTGWGASVGIAITKELGISISANQRGEVETGVYFPLLSIFGASVTTGSEGTGIALGIRRSIGGYNIGGSIGINTKGEVSGSIDLKSSEFGSSFKLLGMSFSSKGTGASFTMAGAGMSMRQVNKGDISVNTSWWLIPIPIGFLWGDPTAWLSVSYSEWEVWLKINQVDCISGSLYNASRDEDTYWSKSFGYLTSGFGNTINEYNIYCDDNVINPYQLNDNVIPRSTFCERTLLSNHLGVSSEDIYSVNCQGLSGSFQPYQNYAYKIDEIYFDDNRNSNRNWYNSIEEDYHNYPDKIQFRFNDDQGGNFTSLQSYYTNDIQPINTTSANINTRSNKKIYPVVDDFGTIIGFKIISDDGKIYEFYKKVMNYGTYAKMLDAHNKASRSWTGSPYATSWLLTGIKGTDYIDRGVPGYSSDDWGFWVKFRYETENSPTFWRNPFSGTAPNPESPSESSFSSGAKETVYLESIETATHIAHFHKSIRSDNIPAYDVKSEGVGKIWKGKNHSISPYTHIVPVTDVFDESPDKYCFRLSTNRWDILGNKQAKFYFNIPKKYLTSLLPARQSMISIKGAFPDNSWLEPPNDAVSSDNYGSLINLVNSESKIEDLGDFCAITANFNNDNINLNASNQHINTATLFIQSENLNKSIYAKQLDRISIHKKTLDVNFKTNYEQSYISPSLENVIYEYDYSLCHGAENSNAPNQGKLTLKKITKTGYNNATYMPSTEFIYSYNPDFHRDKWDYWNGYTSEGNASNHFNSSTKSVADQDAGAWALSSILSPLGAQTDIEYESDQIHYVKASPVFNFNFSQNKSLINHTPGQQTTTFTLNNDNAGIIALFNSGYRDFLILEEDHWDAPLGDGGDPYTGQGYCECCVPNSGIDNTAGNIVRIISISGYQITLQSNFSFKNNIDEWCNTHNFVYYLAPVSYVPIYGGGHRVKKIKVIDGSDVLSSLYTYSGGVATVMPTNYARSYGFWWEAPSLYEKDFNLLGPAPMVNYPTVEISDVNNSNDANLKGKTIFNFFTAKDYQFTCETRVFQVPPSTEFYVEKLFKDKTGIYGKLKSLQRFALKPGLSGNDINDYYPVQMDSFLYAFSSDLGNDNFIPVNGWESDKISRKIIHKTTGIMDVTNKPLGLTQRRYATNMDGNGGFFYFDHRKENVFLISTKTSMFSYTNNNYDTPSGIIRGKTQSIGFDATTGTAIMALVIDSKSDQIVTSKKPAFWVYTGMEDKNMLTQEAQIKSYKIPAGTSFNYTSIPNQYLINSSVTTWKDWVNDAAGNHVWRQNDQFVSTKTKTNFVEFESASSHGANIWNAYNDETNNPSLGDILNGWKRISNITAFDRYSHPIEERSVSGVYTSSIYGFQGALPLAIINNAKNYSGQFLGKEASYIGFESNDETTSIPDNDYWGLYPSNDFSNDAYTGKYSRKILAGAQVFGPTKDLLPDMNGQNRKYLVSCWVKTETGFESGKGRMIIHSQENLAGGGTGAVFPNVTGASSTLSFGDTGGKWKYIETILDLEKVRQLGIQASLMNANDLLQIRCYVMNTDAAHYFLVDDIRIHPVDASMSTFTYDPDTWKLTSITDANNITTYYIYDNAGRLIKVLDQDKNIIKKNVYRYGRGN